MCRPFRAADKKGLYQTRPTVSAEEIVAMAHKLVNRRFAKGRSITSPDAFRDYLQLSCFAGPSMAPAFIPARWLNRR
jgi:hypothetical protein